MFKRAAIKRYGHRLQPKLNKRYGEQSFYSARQVRATVYQCNFNPSYLPLGYLLFLDKPELTDVLESEYPELCLDGYKNEIKTYLDQRKYYGNLELLKG
jgi:hypothetical protein